MGGSAFPRCTAPYFLHRLSRIVFPAPSLPHCLSHTVFPASSFPHRLSCIVFPAPSFPHRLSCTVSPALSLLHFFPPFFGGFSPVCSSVSSYIASPVPLPFLFGGFSLPGISLLFPTGCLVALRPDLGVFPVPAVDRYLPFPCQSLKLPFPVSAGIKKSGPRDEVRSLFEGRLGISNPATWKPRRKSSGRWHDEAPA